jgi:hypothetical protein
MAVSSADQALSISASSGLTVTITSGDLTICSVVAGLLHAVAAGVCTVIATQGGNSTYSAAVAVTKTLTITAANPANISVSSSVVHAGATTHVVATGYKPGTQLKIQIHSTPLDLETITVPDSGTVSVDVAIPTNLPSGDHNLVFNGIDSSTAVATTEQFPISVILNQASTVHFTGRVLTSDGLAVPYATVSVWQVANQSNAALIQTGSDGTFSLSVPTGIDRVSIYWMHYSDTQNESRVLGIPMEWYYTIDKYDVTQDINWTLTLPKAIHFQVKTAPGWTSGGQYISVHPVDTWYGNTSSTSTSFAIANGAVGNFTVGTQDGIWLTTSDTATVTYFPLAHTQIDIGGCIGCLGLANVSVDTGTVVLLSDSSFLTLDNAGHVPTGVINGNNFVGNFANPEYNLLEIQAVDNSWSSRTYISSSSFSVKVPTDIPLYARYSVVADTGNRPSSWAVYLPSFTVTGIKTWNLSLPTPYKVIATNELTPANGSAGINPSISFGYVPSPRTIDLGGGQSAQLIDAFYGGVFHLNGIQEDPKFQENPYPQTQTIRFSGTSATFYSFSPYETVTATTQGYIGGYQTSRTLICAPDLVNTVDFPSGTWAGQPNVTVTGSVVNALGGVGITRVSSIGDYGNIYPLDEVDSSADGSFSIQTTGLTNKILITGASNISSSKGVPTSWWLVVPTSRRDIGTFTLPATSLTRLQVLDSYGLPISNASVLEDVVTDVADFITVTSSNGTVGYLYNGPCYASAGCTNMLDANLANPVTTDSSGYATLNRFATPYTGRIYVSVPGYGAANPSNSFNFDPINLALGNTTLKATSIK